MYVVFFQMASDASPKLGRIGKMETIDLPAKGLPVKSFQVQQMKARRNTMPGNLGSQISTDDEAFHNLAVQLNMIDNNYLAHRDGSRGGTPELHSPMKKQSPEPGMIDLAHYSGMSGGSIETEAPSNKYFEFSGALEGDDSPEEPLPEKRERQTSTRESPKYLKTTGICARLDYPRVKITGKNDITDFAGVSIIYIL